MFTLDQLADFLTKAISRGKSSYPLSKLGIIDKYAPSLRGIVKSYNDDLFCEYTNVQRGFCNS